MLTWVRFVYFIDFSNSCPFFSQKNPGAVNSLTVRIGADKEALAELEAQGKQ